MKTAPLGELCEISIGRTPARAEASLWGRGHPWLSIADMSQGHVITRTKEQITDAGARAGKQVQPGTVLLSFKLSIGKVARAGMPLYTNEAIAALPIKDTKSVDEAYLLRALQSMDLAAGSNRAAMGATLNKATLQGVPIPIPSLDEQRRIAAILDHADALRAKRRRVLVHLDALSRSIFHVMFGVEALGLTALGEVADFYGGASLPPGEAFVGQQGGTMLMKVSDMNRVGNEDEIATTALWTSGSGQRAATVDAGAVVLPKRGASIATNKKRLTTRRTALDPNLMGVHPRGDVLTSRYLFEWFKSFDLATITSGSTVPQLNKQDLTPLRFPLPSIQQQNALAEQLVKMDEQRLNVQRASSVSDQLFASLQSRAFRGEL